MQTFYPLTSYMIKTHLYISHRLQVNNNPKAFLSLSQRSYYKPKETTEPPKNLHPLTFLKNLITDDFRSETPSPIRTQNYVIYRYHKPTEPLHSKLSPLTHYSIERGLTCHNYFIENYFSKI